MKIDAKQLSLQLVIILLITLIGGGIWIRNLYERQQYEPDNKYKTILDSVLQVQKQKSIELDSVLRNFKLVNTTVTRQINNNKNIIINEINKADSIKPILDDRYKLLESARRTSEVLPSGLFEYNGNQ